MPGNAASQQAGNFPRPSGTMQALFLKKALTFFIRVPGFCLGWHSWQAAWTTSGVQSGVAPVRHSNCRTCSAV